MSARLVAAVAITLAGIAFTGSAAHADPAGTMVAFPVTPATGPVIAVGGPDGNIWFTENFGDAVGRMVPSTGAFVEFAIATTDSQPGVDRSRSRRGDVVRRRSGEQDRSHHDERRDHRVPDHNPEQRACGAHVRP